MNKITTISLRRKMAWLTLLPISLAVLGMASYFVLDRTALMDRHLQNEGEIIARQLATSSEFGVFSRNHDILNNLAQRTLQEQRVAAVVILDQNQQILAQAGVALEQGLRWRECLQNQQSNLNHPRRLVLYQPIYSTELALDDFDLGQSSPQVIGSVILEVEKLSTFKEKNRLMLATLIGVLILGILVFVWVRRTSRAITEPIQLLEKHIEAIGRGQLTTRVQCDSRVRELRHLSAGVNHMTEQLQADRDNLQHRIDEATEQLRKLAFYDTLTRLPNRRLLTDRLTQAIAASKRSGHLGALMFIDLDNFKPLNDTHGHAVGDLLLIEVAHRLARCVRQVDTVARLGGDEFVVLLNELDASQVASRDLALAVGEKILQQIEAPFEIVQAAGTPAEVVVHHRCTASIGITLFAASDSVDALLDRADAAMYQAKSAGRNQVFVQ